MITTESFAPWMGKRAHVPNIQLPFRAQQFFDAHDKAKEQPEKPNTSGRWVQDQLPFDAWTPPTTPTQEPITEEPQMEKTTTIPVKHTKAYPKKSKSPTAPGTKPKRKKR